jgi:hypothetical protein
MGLWQRLQLQQNGSGLESRQQQKKEQALNWDAGKRLRCPNRHGKA